MIEIPKLETLESRLFKEIIERKAARVFFKTDKFDVQSLLHRFSLGYGLSNISYDQSDVVSIQPSRHLLGNLNGFFMLNERLKSHTRTLLYVSEIFKLSDEPSSHFDIIRNIIKKNIGIILNENILPTYCNLLNLLRDNSNNENLIVIATSNKVEFDYKEKSYKDFQSDLSLFNIIYEVD